MVKKKKLENILIPEEGIEKRVTGGVVFEMSYCCDAPITYTEGGVKIPICSKCGKTYYEEPLIK